MGKLTGITATLGLTNTLSMTIRLWENGDGVDYCFNGSTDDTIYEAEIETIQDIEDILGYGDDDYYLAFKAIDGNYYFIGEFIRD